MADFARDEMDDLRQTTGTSYATKFNRKPFSFSKLIRKYIFD